MRAAIMLALAASACGSGGSPQLYVLGDAPSGRTVAFSELAQPVVELELVLVPDYLDTTDLLTRGAGGQMVASRSARWGERLSIGVRRAVMQSLAGRLPQLAVTATPPLEEPWRSVSIDVDTFSAQPDGKCVLAGRWSIRERRDGKLLAEEGFAFAAPVGKSGDAEVVAAMSHEVNELAGRIASVLQRQPPR